MSYKPLPKYLTIKESNIDGLGLFATDDIDDKFMIGVSHVRDSRFQDSYIRTPLGGFINHSDESNCEFINDLDFIKLRTLRPIKADEELLAIYTLYKINK